jgi:hypothetical protein
LFGGKCAAVNTAALPATQGGQMRRAAAMVLILGAVLTAGVTASKTPKADGRLKGAVRRPAVDGWTYVHLEGTPAEIGYQHGYLLAAEIQDMQRVFALELTHDDGKDWNFFRDAAKSVLWPHIEQEYREEMQGIADGLNAKGVPSWMDRGGRTCSTSRRSMDID